MNAKNVMRRVFPTPVDGLDWTRKVARRKVDRPGRRADFPGRKLNVVPVDQIAPRPRLATAAGGAVKKLATVPMSVTHSRPRPLADRKTEALGKVLGIIACCCVSAWWLTTVLALVSSGLFELRDTLWSRAAEPMMFVALLGSHFPAAISMSFMRTRDPWGARAVVAFWASILIWVPVAWLLAAVGAALSL